MHILFLPSWYPKVPNDIGGVFFRDQAIALKQAGHDVSLIATNLRSIRTRLRHGKFVNSYCVDRGIKTYRQDVWAALPRVPFGNYLLLKSATFRLFKKFIKQNGLPDIIHAHSLVNAGIIAAELGKKYNIPVVLTEHSTGFARETYKSWQINQARIAVKNVSHRIAVSEPFADLLEQKLGQKWTYLPNIVAERFTSLKSHTHKTIDSRPVILNLALMTPKKGQKYLLEALSLLKKRGVRSGLWLAGDGPIRGELEAYVGELGLSDQVKFLGMIKPEDVPSLMNQADMLVVSSEYETFGVVAAESLTLGKPVVATKCGGPESIIEQGDGLLVPPKDATALSDAIQEVLDNLSGYDANCISKSARARFGAAAIAAKLEEIYANALEGEARVG